MLNLHSLGAASFGGMLLSLGFNHTMRDRLLGGTMGSRRKEGFPKSVRTVLCCRRRTPRLVNSYNPAKAFLAFLFVCFPLPPT